MTKILTLAIVDDIGAILVIAVAYTAETSLSFLVIAPLPRDADRFRPLLREGRGVEHDYAVRLAQPLTDLPRQLHQQHGLPSHESNPYQRYGLYVSEAQDEEDRARRIAETLNHPRYEMRRVVQAARSVEQPFFLIYRLVLLSDMFRPGSRTHA